ncbi:DUF3761 domain-containing protein [Amycolatopsis bartoniae]|nr:DUF3761 domain-containing protein [Amycolatopsis bartoniae]
MAGVLALGVTLAACGAAPVLPATTTTTTPPAVVSSTSTATPPSLATTPAPPPVTSDTPQPAAAVPQTHAAAVPQTHTPTTTKRTTAAAPKAASCSGGYINVDGNCVPSPTHAASPPAGATAHCKDGTYSFSKHRQGTCSGHGGVAEWL